MMSLAAADDRLSPRRMAKPPSRWSTSEELRLLGLALKSMRERARLSQEAAAAKISQSKQSWASYEAGDRQVLLRTDLQDRLTHALGGTREDLALELALLKGETPPSVASGVQDRLGEWEFQRPIHGLARAGVEGPMVFSMDEPVEVIDLREMFGPSVKPTRIAGESLTGYAEDGSIAFYDTKLFPKRGKGAYIVMKSGEVLVKMFREIKSGRLFVEERFPEVRTLDFDMDAIAAVYPIVYRES